MTIDQRLPQPYGILIDRSAPLRFSFEGETLTGLRGDTIASALAANGKRVWSRSFKYHRPRGPLSMAGHDANALVQLPGAPNVAAERTALAAGMRVSAQNVSGSLLGDRWAAVERLSRFLPVGFYYKAFHKPRGAWQAWEPMFRRLAGLGRIDPRARHEPGDKAYRFADVAVVGGGEAGLHAALAAAQSGADVMLIEEGPRLGGSGLYDGRRDAIGPLVAEVEATAGITALTDATATGLFADGFLAVVRADRLLKLRAGAVVVCTGAIEQPMVFRNNDLPGVMLGSAARRLIHLYGVRPGRRAVVVAGNDEGYAVALDLADAGVEVAAVLDLRAAPTPGPELEAVRARGLRHLPGHTVVEARPSPGKRGVVGAGIGRIDDGSAQAIPGDVLWCDLICTSVGYSPAAHLLCHAGVALGYDEALSLFTLGALPDGVFAAGAVNNSFAADAARMEAREAGWLAAAHAGHRKGRKPRRPPADRGGAGINHPYPYFPHPDGRDFVDVDEDLQVKDILTAVAEGYDHIELTKRFSTVGMGPSQGRHSALATARIVARAMDLPVEAVGTTTWRPPTVPETLGVLAGRAFEPERRTPLHHRHLEAGARMMVAGAWWRPAYYGPSDRNTDLITEEVEAVRRWVGLIDVSTLGGIAVRGPDAAEMLNRVYTFAYKKQPVGRVRYVLMCDQTGAIVDDGVACRLGDDHFYVTTTTGGSDTVYRQMLWWNAQWRLDVDITNVTAAFAGISLVGPRSRKVLSPLTDDIDLSPEAFPYLAVREGRVAGIPCRLLRVGFVGELGYELHCPASQAEALWDALVAGGHGIRPVGIEAQRVLRLEKGHIIVGQDTDGLTTPLEADMVWALARRKPFYVGGRTVDALARQPLKRKLVGFTLNDRSAPAPRESDLVVRDDEIVGRVTSVAQSAALGRVIGLAYVAPDQAEPGQTFIIRVHSRVGGGGTFVLATVVPTPFLDPSNRRQDM